MRSPPSQLKVRKQKKKRKEMKESRGLEMYNKNLRKTFKSDYVLYSCV
jgi:hypothetical protein